MDSSSLSAVLYNPDLLSVICEELWASIQSSSYGAKPNPLVSLATVCTSVSETALDRLWKHIHGFTPLLRVFNARTSRTNNGSSIWTIPIEVPQSKWDRFERYAQRVRSMTLDASSGTRDHPSVYLRLMAQFSNAPLFSSLKRLEVDPSFASEPQILFLLSSPNLQEVEIILESIVNNDTLSTSVRTAVAGRETFILSGPLTTHAGYDVAQSFIDRACPATFFTGKDLCCLKITSHPATYSFLEELSSSESLKHLQFIFGTHTLSHSHDIRDGFSVLKTLHVTGDVASMSRVLRLVVPDILESFTFIDNSFVQSYHYACVAMQHFHVELVERFNLSLHSLSLTYRHWTIGQEDWEASRVVFEPLYGLGPPLKALHYSGNLAMDQKLVEEKLVTAWPGIETICIPRLAIPPPCDVLPVLAEHCRHLACLTLPIAFPDSATLSPPKIRRHRLRAFSPTDVPIQQPACVARYLDRIFPFLTNIEGGKRWDEVERIILHA
ncbi:uncharacterized protein BT62DRAFT_936293 [Guyanagaster necrorhizus]|uniref:F-box domain-containing protein n=1 Tax=Guyanagaster necrorhizus TaxID=856835 RepID=A0A9P8ANT2_9AGAR|nr:uncharacterized protein BT62DRAFT_936293 [Guyanagaster necrorhizus MCA 3950]KAG7442189.1 hypothetical protein BT62DRAFT_936293 [Guyanagaster necrorhizus MCA 3950]